jgi:hypothetical protein
MFYGIIIRMYAGQREHNPPHIHAFYQDYKASFSIQTAQILEGNMSKDQTQMIQVWIILHKDELMADWELACNNEQVYKIKPLR